MRFFLPFIVFSIFNLCGAQEFKLGKVSKQELSQKTHAKDSSAAGCVLYNTYKSSFHYTVQEGFSAKHVFTIRLKIYKKEGLSLANYEIPYYIGYENLNPDRLEIRDAATYNLEGDKIIRTKVDASSMIKEKVNEYWKTKTLVFPNAKVGSVLEFQYVLLSENLYHFPTFNFQREIPVDVSEYLTEIPVNYIYKPVVSGLLPLKAECRIEAGRQNYDNKFGQTETLEFQQQICSYKAVDVPALQMEPMVDNLNNYKLSIDHEIELIRFPNTPDKNFSQTWEGLVKTIWKDEDFGMQLSDCTFLDNEVRRIVNNESDYLKRMGAIFKYVQSGQNWNGKFGFSAETGIRKAFQTGTGNIGDINLLLTAMLVRAGIDARPVLVSTVKNGISVYPRQTSFNYVVVRCLINGNEILLDATNKFTIPGILPTHALNWSGRVVSGDGSSSEIKMIPPETSIERTVLLGNLESNGKLSGKAKRSLSCQKAFVYRENHSMQDRENYLEGLENELNKIEIGQYDRKSDLEKAGLETETFDFSGNAKGEVLGDKMFIDPFLILPHLFEDFRATKRTLPVYLGDPSDNIIQITLTLPEGYVIESLPSSIAMSTPENVCSFKYTVLGEGNKISLQRSYKTNLRLVSADFYDTLKEFHKKVSEKENERIVLKKL